MDRRGVAFIVLALFGGGCVDKQISPTFGQVTTLKLDLLSPEPGSPAMPNTSRDTTFNLTAYDDIGEPYGGDATIDMYLSYGGVRTGQVLDCGSMSEAPIESIPMRGGKLENHHTTLPEAYGTTALWAVERGSNVVGSSNPIYFPNPTIPNIQTPPDPASPNATFCTSFEDKFVRVDHATGSGKLLVDSVFGGAITVTDTGATDYRSIYIFTFGKPASYLVPGKPVRYFTGNISKFVGFTELNFPTIEASVDDAPMPQLLPKPIPLSKGDITNLQKLNAAAASVVEISGKVCPVNPPNPNQDSTIQNTIDQWVKYNTFVLAQVECGDAFGEYSVALPAKVVGTFDPTKLLAQPATIRGMLKNSSGQNEVTDARGNPIKCDPQTVCASGTCVNGLCMKKPYNFWTVVVRGPEDVPQ